MLHDQRGFNTLIFRSYIIEIIACTLRFVKYNNHSDYSRRKIANDDEVQYGMFAGG